MVRGSGPLLASELTEHNSCILSHSGQPVPGASSSISDLVQNHRNGDLIMLHLGTNDLDQLTHVNICDNYGRLLDKIKQAAPNSTIALTAAANQKRPGSATINRKTDHINRSLHDMCTFDQRLTFFDCNPEIQSSNTKKMELDSLFLL